MNLCYYNIIPWCLCQWHLKNNKSLLSHNIYFASEETSSLVKVIWPSPFSSLGVGRGSEYLDLWKLGSDCWSFYSKFFIPCRALQLYLINWFFGPNSFWQRYWANVYHRNFEEKMLRLFGVNLIYETSVRFLVCPKCFSDAWLLRPVSVINMNKYCRLFIEKKIKKENCIQYAAHNAYFKCTCVKYGVIGHMTSPCHNLFIC